MIHAYVGSAYQADLCLLSLTVIVVVIRPVEVAILLDVVASDPSEVHRGDRIVSPLVVVGLRATVQHSILVHQSFLARVLVFSSIPTI
jgi:ethanolamine utilization microcompartment shell protein EutS